MFDRLEARAGPEVPFTRGFESAYRDLRRYPDPAGNYKEMLYLKEFGADAILFRWCRFGASHKLVFLQAGKKTLGQIASGIATVLDWDPYDLRLARLDLALDLVGISMEWARSHVSVARKRSLSEIRAPRKAATPNTGNTLTFGRGADSIRIYDKRTEQLKEFRRWMRRLGSAALPSFEEFSGMATGHSPVIRVERQLRIGRIPPQLATLTDLERNITAFDPFSPIVIHPGGKLEPNIEEFPLRRYWEGKGFRQTILEHGLPKILALLNARSRGNARRKIQQMSDFLPPDPEGFTSPNLFAGFQRSIVRQPSRSFGAEEIHETQITTVDNRRSDL